MPPQQQQQQQQQRLLLLGEDEDDSHHGGGGGGLFCARTSSRLYHIGNINAQLKELGRAAKNETIASIKDRFSFFGAPRPPPPPSAAAHDPPSYTDQPPRAVLENASARPDVRYRPGFINDRLRARFAGAPPPNDAVWNKP